MKLSRKIPFLLLFAITLASTSPAVKTASDVMPFTAVDTCETTQDFGCEDTACGNEPNPDNEDCCGSGCQLCSLLCCSGSVMLMTASHGPDPVQTTDDRLATFSKNLVQIEPVMLYRPPRA